MTDLSHLDALQARLARETARRDFADRVGLPNERAFRQREITACEKEITAEYKFLGIAPLTMAELLMSDDDLLNELGA